MHASYHVFPSMAPLPSPHAKCAAPRALPSCPNVLPTSRRLVHLLCALSVFATYNCKACTFSVALLEMSAGSTPDGGLADFRVWSARRFRAFPAWAQGRNQALFALPSHLRASPGRASSRGGGVGGGGERGGGAHHTLLPALMVQPWLGLVASFGVPAFHRTLVDKCYREQADWYGSMSEAEAERKMGRKRMMRLWGTTTCGTMPIGAALNSTSINLWAGLSKPRRGGRKPRRGLYLSRMGSAISTRTSTTSKTSGGIGGAGKNATSLAVAELLGSLGTSALAHPSTFGDLQLIANHTALERRRRTFDVGGHRVSPTANLVRVRWGGGDGKGGDGKGGDGKGGDGLGGHGLEAASAGECEALLGVGHTHRGTGVLERKSLRLSAERRADYSGGLSSRAGMHGRVARRRLGGGGGGGDGGGGGGGRGRGGGGGGRRGRGGKGRGGGDGSNLGRRLAESDEAEPFQFGYRYTHFW